jgi:hypothetical protein
MEQLDYNLLFRWFVGMDMDEPIWAPTVFSKNRDRLLNQDDMLTAERNRREHATASVRPGLTDHIRWLERRVAEVDRDLEQRI